MFDEPSLLVVDDEEVVCEGCRRIFSRQGFRVEKSCDAREGLSLATEKDYSAVLLDIKMPTMDGIQFLEKLRGRKPDLPVILITGYPTIPNAASAVRLDASDYVTKPFTAEEITQAVQRVLAQRGAKGNAAVSAMHRAEPWAAAAEEFHFWDESWFQPGTGGSVRVGAVLARPQKANVQVAGFPSVGEAVYQGLPLAALNVEGKPQRTVPSPLSGVVLEVNPVLREGLPALWDDPCGSGWIACISPTRLDEDTKNSKLRRVVLANAERASAGDQCERLTALGCQVCIVAAWEELAPTVPSPDQLVLVIDAASFGRHGPELVQRVNTQAPSMRVVVVGSPDSQWEAAYREHKIFYYAVEPFADNEIVEILDAVFRPQRQPVALVKHRKTPSEFVSSIFITNRNGKKICLLAAGGLLQDDCGLGWHVGHKLLDRLYQSKTTLGEGNISQVKILAATSMCDRLLVLMTRDMGRIPGSLLRDTTGEFVSVFGEDAGKVMALVVQPDPCEGGLAGLDDRTTEALAEHIVGEMTICQ